LVSDILDIVIGHFDDRDQNLPTPKAETSPQQEDLSLGRSRMNSSPNVIKGNDSHLPKRLLSNANRSRGSGFLISPSISLSLSLSPFQQVNYFSFHIFLCSHPQPVSSLKLPRIWLGIFKMKLPNQRSWKKLPVRLICWG